MCGDFVVSRSMGESSASMERRRALRNKPPPKKLRGELRRWSAQLLDGLSVVASAGRQRESKYATRRGRKLGPGAATNGFDRLPDNAQSEPRSCRLGYGLVMGAVKLFEEPAATIVGNTDAV